MTWKASQYGLDHCPHHDQSFVFLCSGGLCLNSCLLCWRLDAAKCLPQLLCSWNKTNVVFCTICAYIIIWSMQWLCRRDTCWEDRKQCILDELKCRILYWFHVLCNLKHGFNETMRTLDWLNSKNRQQQTNAHSILWEEVYSHWLGVTRQIRKIKDNTDISHQRPSLSRDRSHHFPHLFMQPTLHVTVILDLLWDTDDNWASSIHWRANLYTAKLPVFHFHNLF